MKQSTKGILIGVIVLLIFSGIGLWFLLSNTTTEINVTEFHKSIVEDNKVVAVSIEDDIVSVQMKGSSRYEYSVKIQQNNTTWLYNGTEYNSLTAFITAYNENNSAGVKIAVSQNDRNEGSFVSYIFPVVGFIILIVLAFFAKQ